MKLKKQCVVSVSYFNYLFSIGGTDKFILEQKEFCTAKGYDYIYVYNSDFLMNKLHLTHRNKWIVLINDNHEGVFTKQELIEYLKNIDSICCIKKYIVNHLMNIDIGDLVDIFYKKDVPISFFIHDYYTLCPHSGLVDDAGVFCGKTKQNSNCLCSGINHRLEDNFADLFCQFLNNEKERISLFFPSEIARKIWLSGYHTFADICKVLPHYSICEWKTVAPRKISEVLSIAYVGNDLPHKGYQKWKKFVTQVKEIDSAIKLYHFGICNEKLPGVIHVDVDYSKEDDKLTSKLVKYGIDCVVLWSLVPETYSYTYYESYCADCFVLTNNISGNIAAQTIINGNGIVSDDIDGLIDIVRDSKGFRDKLDMYFGNSRKIPLIMKNNQIDLPSDQKQGTTNYIYSKSNKLHLCIYIMLENTYRIIRLIRRKMSK